MNDFHFSQSNHAPEYNGPIFSQQPSQHQNGGAPAVACDYFSGVYEYIKHMLMEEEDDLENRPCMLQDCSALQAAEKYFHDALSDTGSAPLTPDPDIPPFSFHNPDSSRSASGFRLWSTLDCSIYGDSGPSFSCEFDRLVGPLEGHFQETETVMDDYGACFPDQILNDNVEHVEERRVSGKCVDRGGRGDCAEERNSKQLASSSNGEDFVEIDKYDKSLLCPKMNPGFFSKPLGYESDGTSGSEEENMKKFRKTREVKRGRPKGSKKNRKVSQVVDLGDLLTRCAEAAASYNIKSGEHLLKQIRNHSSPSGDANERLAHCFANALEARMAGTGSAMYAAIASRRVPALELLKSYQAYVTVCPFKRMSNVFANKSIASLTKEANKIHIIDFGILYGFQWPCIIQGLSLKPGGPPRLKITGINYPQPGFKPAERVEQTGRRLSEYCKRFSVPFEYNAVAKRWEDIKVEEDLKIERDEMLVVNCLYRLRHVPDESAGVNSPRNGVLNLIKKLKPRVFVHGVVNGTFNASFFGTRLKEAVYHYSSFFDMMEATLPREDQDRLMYEREVFGRDVMNVIACEGSERVERPESYKQWQVRNERAGFKQMRLDKEIVNEVKIKVKTDYHNDFLVEEDKGWLLQGWKGRVLYALSCWKPIQE
ncbi:hypothetical protein ACS0TY_008159 [Phlomoides rotata]